MKLRQGEKMTVLILELAVGKSSWTYLMVAVNDGWSMDNVKSRFG